MCQVSVGGSAGTESGFGRLAVLRRIITLAGIMFLSILLGGCTVNMGFFVHNGYPFAVSITEPYTDFQNKPQHMSYGKVYVGQLRRMPRGLSRYGPAHLEVRNPQNQIVRQVWISQNQFNHIYMASKTDAAAVYLSVGPGQAIVVGRDDPRLIAAKARDRITVWVGLVTGSAIFALWVALQRRSRRNV